MENLIIYLNQNKIQYTEIDEDFIEIAGIRHFLVRPTEGKLFTDEFILIADSNDCERFVYCFGGNWYWEKRDEYSDPKLNELKYLGVTQSPLRTESFLGVRGGYEILNGSRLYEDWVKKAKFLECKALGICEKNTLAGILKFQLACQKEKIKSIIGATYTVVRESADLKYDIKVYVQNEIGWQSLLKINKEVNVTNHKWIPESLFLKSLDGLFVVVDPKSLNFEDLFPIDLTRKVYYQLDTVEFVNNETDGQYLSNLKKFFRSDLSPVSITDAFYLDKEHSYIKKILNQIGGLVEPESSNQHFKGMGEYFLELKQLFNENDEDLYYDTLMAATANQKFIVDHCNFTIELGQKYLPNYERTAEESEKFKTNEELFWYLIEKGLDERLKSGDVDTYLDRIKREFIVIKKGGFIDYFLILWDIIRFAKENGILSGIGRGSAGGSLIAYLLGIIKLNPLQFNLLFERFLNEGRIGLSLPDIDTDFPGERRNEIKRYMESKYGVEQVCSVGTYTTLKMKAALKELARQHSLNPQDMNYLTSLLDLEKETMAELFLNASQKSVVKKFIHQHPDLINTIPLLLKQVKTASIHACATLILPKEKTVYEWLPVKIMKLGDGEDVIVTEWEGIELEAAGFLKEDILGIQQLDKFQSVINLIKKNRDIDIDIEEIPYTDKKVLEYFRKGWNSDVFHFGSKGLSGYCKMLQPQNIDDLIAGIALYRPGTMEGNFHNEYVIRSRRVVERRQDKEPIEYDFGLKSVTENTYGIYCYQEQIMQACTILGGFSLTEGDDIRRAMGKKKKDLIDSYGQRFIVNAQVKGCPKKEAEEIWEKQEKFASYGFNKSHAAAYAITGYISQWFKVNFPVEFWSTAFSFAEEKDHANYIAEINLSGDIKVLPADINKSRDTVFTDFKAKTIFWPLISIKQCGEKAASQIIELRDKDGEYFSLEEFYSRNRFTGSAVNKAVIENLIFAGAFDQIENVRTYHQRHLLIEQYREIAKSKIVDDKCILSLNYNKLNEDWWWTLQQKRVSGIAFFDYNNLLDRFIKKDCYKVPAEEFQSDTLAARHEKVKIGGYIMEVEEKDGKKGKWCKIKLESNYVFIWVTIWHDQYKKLIDLKLPEKLKSILLISGEVDTYRDENILKANDDTEIIILG